MLLTDLIFTAIVLAFAVLIFILIKTLTKKAGTNFVAQQIELGKTNGYIEEMISGQKVVKVFNYEEKSIEGFDLHNDNLFDKCEELGYSEMIKPYYFRHDECIIQVNEGIIDFLGQEKFEEFLRDTFEHQIDNWVPFNVEISEVKPTTDLNELLKEE